MTAMLLCFSGQIGSGKSSVSKAVAEALSWRRTGFGEYLRSEITRRGGDPDSREALQDLGQRLVEAEPENFCRSVLAAGGFTRGENFVIDGVRHVEILRSLRRIASPSIVRLVFLGADENFRSVRINERMDKDDFTRATSHRVEVELQNDLPAIADEVIDATQAFNDVVVTCLAAISVWSQG